MSNETTNTDNARQDDQTNRPKFAVKLREGRGKNASYDRIGVAWENKDGSIYVKLHGTQIIDKGFTLYAIERDDSAA